MTRDECLSTARKLLRTFGSAPDARRRAQEIFQALSRCSALSIAERGEVQTFGQWLAGKPSTGELKPRCESLLAGLG